MAGQMIGGVYVPDKTGTKYPYAGGSAPQWGSLTPAVVPAIKPATVIEKDLTKDNGEDKTAAVAVAAETSGAYPEFSVDLEGIWERAGMLADADLNPQLAEIDRLLQESGFTADESKRAIDEAYPIARRSIQKSIYENFIAGESRLAGMGTGRGGGRQELLSRAGTREAVGITELEKARMREKGAINRALANYTAQQGGVRTALVGTRGGLQAGYAEQLRANRFNEAGLVYGAAVDKYNAFNPPSGTATVGEATNTLLGSTPTPTTTDKYDYFYNASAAGTHPNTILAAGKEAYGEGYNPWVYVDPKTKKPVTWHNVWGG